MQEKTAKQQFVIRPYTHESDFQRLITLLSEVEAADQEGIGASKVAPQEQLSWPEFERWVVAAPHDPEVLIGDAWVFSQTPARMALALVVHPAWQRKGLGSTLLAHVLHYAKKGGAAQVLAGANEKNRVADAFLRRHGFAAVGSSWSLYASADVTLEQPIWPEGYSVRSYAEVQNLTILTKLLNRSYGDMRGHAENTPGAVTEASLASRVSASDPEAMFLVFSPAGEAVGFCEVLRQADSQQGGPDILDGPGIVPEYRHLGLHRPLVLTAMRWQRQHGQGRIILESFGDDEATIAIYQDIGFTLDIQDITYLKHLD